MAVVVVVILSAALSGLDSHDLTGGWVTVEHWRAVTVAPHWQRLTLAAADSPDLRARPRSLRADTGKSPGGLSLVERRGP